MNQLYSLQLVLYGGGIGMRIKEIEELSGIERSNIRFYEREGLLSPKRLENGYRDYSDEDLEILLKIKLLRSLHISLDEIKGLKEGEKKLSTILGQQISSLEGEKKDLSYAQDICRTIKEENTEFRSLDAKKYLENIDEISSQSASSYFLIEGDSLAQVFHPWRRFLARLLDINIYSTIWLAFLGFTFQVNILYRSNWGDILDITMAIGLMLLIEPLLLRLFGTTPGKAIFGLRLENKFGKNLSYGDALERTWGVFRYGLGLNIPIYNIVCLRRSFIRCNENEVQPWDYWISYKIKDRKWYRNVLYVGGLSALIFLTYTISAAQLLPPNRGDITVEEFVENHNYYARYLGVNFGMEFLDTDGEWEKKLDHIDTGYKSSPEYKFTLENGYVEAVSFSVEIDDNVEIIPSYDNQMIISSLALVGAQDEVHLFSKIPNRIIKQIRGNTFYDFNIEEGNIEINCETENRGYRYIEIFPSLSIFDDNAEESYFKLDFSVSK